MSSSSARPFFRSNNRSQHRLSARKPLPNNTLVQQPMNVSCCGGDEKKTAIKNQVQAPPLKEQEPVVEQKKLVADPMEASDHKIQHIPQQQAVRVDVDDDLKDLFGKREVTKAMINQLAQRALTGSMSLNNDDPPRLCTKKHCSFANEPLTIKPVTCVPGIGPKHGHLCEKQGIIMAHQLLSRYMMSANGEEFEKSLINQLNFTPKSAAMARDGLKEMRRHLI
ncbi:unnamed protein product [Adineta ricciae]|uniref:Uncharacterized protein n=1 Tax=Adineta ricciae TaxID=249248 RepID=A0A813RIS8_ADIRI|nr:unnamed protein product [Adineta ricciae]CAF0840637.1 unnamed protein product [Adineta ricciae]